MATTYKLYSAATTDGVVYIDLPISGRVSVVNLSLTLSAGAGGVGIASCELSRVAVNQIATSNPRGVVCSRLISTSAASTGASVDTTFWPDEPVKSGERLYLNCAGSAVNATAATFTAFVTIV